MVPSRRRFLHIHGAPPLVECRGHDRSLTGIENFDEMLDQLHHTAPSALEFGTAGAEEHTTKLGEAVLREPVPELCTVFAPW